MEHEWVECDVIGRPMGTTFGQQRFGDWLCVHCGMQIRPSNKSQYPENSQISPTCDEMIVSRVQEEDVDVRIGSPIQCR